MMLGRQELESLEWWGQLRVCRSIPALGRSPSAVLVLLVVVVVVVKVGTCWKRRRPVRGHR